MQIVPILFDIILPPLAVRLGWPWNCF